MKLVRVLGVVLALVVCAWFVIGIRQAHDLAAASNIANGSGRLSPQTAAHAQSLINAAGQLNPDVQVEITRSQLALRLRHYGQAVALARAATRREPSNVTTWLALAVAGYDSGTVIQSAVAKISQLHPQLAHSVASH